jgi:excisionase family DNA binding protein
VGAILQVNPSSVNKWVRDGRIQAFRTPGGHHRIKASDLISFLNAHKMPVPRKLSNAARTKLLVVDDDPKFLGQMQRMLKPYASRVELRTVDNGIDALIQVGAFAPGVVLLDVVMPNLDGIEVCRRIKGMPETGKIKVVMTSAELTSDIEKDAKKAGAAMSLAKPIETSALLSLLELDDIVAETRA